MIVGHPKPHFEVENAKAPKPFKQYGDIVYAYECIKTPINPRPLFPLRGERPKTILVSGATEWYPESIRQDEAKITFYNS